MKWCLNGLSMEDAIETERQVENVRNEENNLLGDTLSRKNSSGKNDEILAWRRTFFRDENFPRRIIFHGVIFSPIKYLFHVDCVISYPLY